MQTITRTILLTGIAIILGMLCAESAFSMDAKPNVLYAGVMLAGGRGAEANFPLYHRDKIPLARTLTGTLQTMSDADELPFTILFSTDAQSRKQEISDRISLVITLTRDDVAVERLITNTTEVDKVIVNVGLNAVLYETADIDGVQRNTVLYSFPLVGYSQSIAPKLPTQDDLDRLFLTTASGTLKNYLAKGLQHVSLTRIRGKVTGVADGACLIDIGAVDGLDAGQNVKFLADNNATFYGKIAKLDAHTATIRSPAGKTPVVGMDVTAINMKGYSDNTYQVVEVNISSPKAAQLFPAKDYAPSIAQWFSSFLASREGKAVMPSRVGGEWDVSATDNAFKLIDEDGNEYRFTLPPPKYPISLDFTGMAVKVAKSNEVNDVVLYKEWMKLTMPTASYAKEFDDVSSRISVREMLQHDQKDELYDLLYKLTEKIAREATF